ncbi:MAG: class II fructose-bisphosphate aldolase [Chloroflexota bacterium]|jgi:fructose/tagatose bisphosphate aldolase
MTAPRVAASVGELVSYLDGICHIEGERLVIDDVETFRATGIKDVVWSATFSEDEAVVEAARWIVWEASQELGCPSASIHELYMARSRDEYSGWTEPAINLRTQVFDMAAAGCRAAMELGAGSPIWELARSEQAYTFQRPPEYITSVLAGAIHAGWQGPIFIQGDHYQWNAKNYAKDPDQVTGALHEATLLSMSSGYGNIDIDSSTLVDLSFDSLDEQQQVNYTRAAELAAVIREQEELTISIGGEIGEVGKANSTPDELRAYLDGFNREFRARAGEDAIGLSKVSVQTGTSHGGVPTADGKVAEVKLDFEVLRELGLVAREYGLGGAVQHGASTLPDDLFHKFPEAETLEIHLATGFQNALYEHPRFPSELYQQVEQYCFDNLSDERSDGQTDAQFVYKTRKKALGPIKRELWDLETKDQIIVDQQAKMKFLFEQLGITGNKATVEKYVTAPERHKPLPAGLKA